LGSVNVGLTSSAAAGALSTADSFYDQRDHGYGVNWNIPAPLLYFEADLGTILSTLASAAQKTGFYAITTIRECEL
jgi:hypothetical protein